MRLQRLAPLTLLIFALTPACGEDDPNPTPHVAGGSAGAGSSGVGGSGGGSSGGSSAGNASAAGSAGKAAGGSGGQASGGTNPMDGGAAGMGGEGGDPNPVDCSQLATVPADVEILTGFTSSEDFAFDELGNYVGVDDSQNLVRISKEGKKELWAPNIGATAGMAMLPDGSAIVADVPNGAIKRVYPNGAAEVVIGGLLYPNGLDVGPDGFVYVAENNAGRVRRVNPDNGEFTIVAMGLHGPNGVAFASDPKLMYVGSFEGSGVYKVQIPGPGQLGTASVFARPNHSTLPEPKLACPDQQVGKNCRTSTTEMPGKCKQLSNVIDCVPDDSCEGDACEPVDACDGKKAGDACNDPSSGPGKCADFGGGLYCEPLNPCEGKPNGTECDYFGEPGTCQEQTCGWDPCAGKDAGDTCNDFGVGGVCVGPAQGPLECVNQCAGKPEGTACGNGGKCVAESCTVKCTAQTLGQTCAKDDGEFGVCVDNGQGPVCEPGGGEQPGGIDGLGVDGCGNVYASEFTHGYVWRISPSGEIVKLVTLPSSWVPNIKWGRGVGGFERNIMYVADRDQGRLFGVSVGVVGATEFYDIGDKP